MAANTIRLCDLKDGEEGDFFAMMSTKEELTTRDGKPYFKVGFRDARREVAFPIWNDSPRAREWRETWATGEFYKIRALYRETSYGPQLDLRKIRPTREGDAEDGFDPLTLAPRSRFDPERMFEEILALAREGIEDSALRETVIKIHEDHRETLLRLPAASRKHHAFAGGYLEHVLSVARTCEYWAEKYAEQHDLDPPLSRELVIAGALLHDVGKLRELDPRPEGAAYTAAGELLGHVQQGRDVLRETAAETGLSPEFLLRLEHVIVSHQGSPESGSPKPPMTLEALLVFHADACDVQFHQFATALRDAAPNESFTSDKNPLRRRIYRGTIDATLE
ncbi:MAG: HD domain-containing protein [Planctomycetales bacterium]